MKDIFKISLLYFKKYIGLISIILVLFSLVGFANGNGIKSELRSGALTYFFNKEYNYNNFILNSPLASNYDEEYWNEHSERFNKFGKTFDKKLTSEDIDEVKNNVALELYLGSGVYEISIYKPTEYTFDDSARKSFSKYFTIEQIDNINKLEEFKTKANSIYAMNLSEEERTKNIEDVKKLSTEIEGIYKNYAPVNGTNHTFLNLAKNNLDNDSANLSIKEIFYSTSFIIWLSLSVISIVMLIFGLEYHTSFGKFVASMPYKKTTVYFAKIITSLVILLLGYAVLGLTSIWAVKTSVISDIVSVSTAFLVYNKIYLFGLIILLLGIVFASFCGSVISIVCMYLPTLMFASYPVMLFVINYRAFTNFNYEKNNELILKVSKIFEANPLYVPGRLFIGYHDFKYYIILLLILFALIVLCAQVYKKHNIDEEGRFFTIKSINIICYVLALISFATLFSTFLVTLGLNFFIANIIAYGILTPILYLIFRIKIRI